MLMQKDRIDTRAVLPMRLCTVVVPGNDPTHTFLARDLVAHVATLYDYRVQVVTPPPARPPTYARQLEAILESELMVFDLSGANPSICFEVGLRYMSGLPMVCFIARGEAPPPLLDHVGPIAYTTDATDFRAIEHAFIDRLKDIAADDEVAGRPIFEVQHSKLRTLKIGGFDLNRDTVRALQDFARRRRRSCDGGGHGNGGAGSSGGTGRW